MDDFSLVAGPGASHLHAPRAIHLALARVNSERECPQIYEAGMPTAWTRTAGKVFIDHSVDSELRVQRRHLRL